MADPPVRSTYRSTRLFEFWRYALGWCSFVLATVHPVVTHAGQYGDFTYEITDSLVRITDYAGDEPEVVIPDSIEELPVTTIGQYAFMNTANLETVTIPGTVRLIERMAFSDCRRLAEVNLAEGLMSVGDYAFSGSLRLSTVNIPATVTSLGLRSFSGPNLTRIDVAPDNPAYRSVEGVLFNQTGSILLQCPEAKGTEYAVPAGVTEIGEQAFVGCADLERVALPDGLTRIGERSFYFCERLTEITIPGSVMTVGAWAFYRCQALSELMLPEGIVELERYAFSDCSTLTQVVLPASVSVLGDGVFSGCTSLAAIEVDPANAVYASSLGVLFSSSMDGTVLEQYPPARTGDYSIPSGVTSIRKSAFSECTGLTAVTIPEGVTGLGSYTFGGCTSLTHVTIPEGVTEIGSACFIGCRSLVGLELPNTLRTIGERAFQDCTALAGVVFPATLTVDRHAFRGCTALASLEFPSEGALFLQPYAFYGCTALTRVTLPRSVVSVEQSSFAYCSNVLAYEVDPEHRWYASRDGVLFNKDLTELLQYPAGREGAYAIPEGVRVVYDAFAGSAGLTRLSLSQSISGFGGTAVDGCPNLVAIEVDPENPNFSSVGGVLYNKEGTYLVRCPEGWVGVVEVPASVQFLALGRVPGVTAIEVDPENLSYSSMDGVLYSKDQTRLIRHPMGKGGSFTVPATVTRIENGAFTLCAELTSVNVEAGITTLGYSAFEGCSRLQRVVLPASLVRIDLDAFDGCPNLAGIYFHGDRPVINYTYDELPFRDNPAVILFYRAGTFFWEPFAFERPTAPWVDPPVYADWLPTTDLPSRYPASVEESDDPDQDGMSNYSEMLAGTDPVDGRSSLVLESAPRPGDLSEEDRAPLPEMLHAVYFRSVPGKRYGAQRAPGIDGPWETAEVVTATTTQTRVEFGRPEYRAFYRVILAQ